MKNLFFIKDMYYIVIVCKYLRNNNLLLELDSMVYGILNDFLVDKLF